MTMPINLDDFRKLHECKGNKHNRIFVVEHRETREVSILKVIAIRNLERQLREIETHCSVHGEFIIRLKEYHVTTNHIFMLIEFAKHGDLFSFIPKLRQVTKPTLLRFYYQVVLAVDYLHSRGFVHRDIKPENVLIASKFVPKLADFGASSKIGLIKNTFCGTYEYMAPEILNRQQQTEKVDVWSLGILLFEMVCGKTPFKNLKPMEIRAKLATRELGFAQGVDPDIQAFVLRVLQFEPQKRPSTKEMLADPLFARVAATVPGGQANPEPRNSLAGVMETEAGPGETDQRNSRMMGSQKLMGSWANGASGVQNDFVPPSNSRINFDAPKTSLQSSQLSHTDSLRHPSLAHPSSPLQRPVFGPGVRMGELDTPQSSLSSIPSGLHSLSSQGQASPYQMYSPSTPQNVCSIDPAQSENKQPPVVRLVDFFRTETPHKDKNQSKNPFARYTPSSRGVDRNTGSNFPSMVPAVGSHVSAPSSHKIPPLSIFNSPSQRTVPKLASEYTPKHAAYQSARSNKKMEIEDSGTVQMTPLSLNKQPSMAKVQTPHSDRRGDSTWLDSIGRFGSTAKIFFARFKQKQD